MRRILVPFAALRRPLRPTLDIPLRMSNSEFFWAGFKAISIQLMLAATFIFFERQVTWAMWVGAYPPLKLGVFLFVILILPAPFTKHFRLEMTRRREEKLRLSSHALDQFSLELVDRLQSDLHLSGVQGANHWSLHIQKSSGISFEISISRDSLEWGAIAVNSKGLAWKECTEYYATNGEWPEALQKRMASEVFAFANTLLASEVRGTTQRKLLKSRLFVEWKVNNSWQATRLSNV